MEATHNVVLPDKRWRVVNASALLVGIATSLVLAKPGPNPVLKNMERFRGGAQIAHYWFHPLTYVAVAAVFAFVVVRNRYVGLWSAFCSFTVGGLLASALIAIAQQPK